jgi:hypothetical protein
MKHVHTGVRSSAGDLHQLLLGNVAMYGQPDASSGYEGALLRDLALLQGTQ